MLDFEYLVHVCYLVPMNNEILILNYMLYHDEELTEEELHKCFAKFDSKTLELIKKEYEND